MGEVIDNGRTTQSATFQHLIKTIKEYKIPYRSISKGDTLSETDRVKVTFLHPPSTETNDASVINNTSVVIHLTYNDFSILLSGDIEQEAEQYLVNTHPELLSTILKVPHHGSRTSSSTIFLQAVRPEAAIISVGIKNRFQHPSPVVLDRYQRMGIKLHRTDLDGAIIIQSDGETFRIKNIAAETPKKRWVLSAEARRSILLTGILGWSIFR